jgi:tetratricopeptide (TPR) repeat protein
MLDKAQELNDSAKQAYENFDYDAAYQLYSEALNILRKQTSSNQADRLEVQTYNGIIDTLTREGKWVMALEYADALISEASNKGDKRLKIGAALTACSILLNHGNWIEAKRRYDATLEMAEKTGNNLAIAECFYGLAYVDCRNGDNKAARVKTKKALDILERVEPSLLQCKAIIECGSIADAIGDSPQAILYFRLAIEKLKKFPPNEELARAYNNMGEAYKNLEDYEAAAREYWNCVEAARQVKSKRAELYGLCNIAECYAFNGKTDDAKDIFNEVDELLRTTSEKFINTQLPFIRGLIGHGEKDYEDAVENYDLCIKRLKRIGELPYDLGITYYRKGLALEELGKGEIASEAFKEAKRYFEMADAKQYLRRLAKYYP